MSFREINEEGLGIIKTYEGLELERYKCPGGVWTIGYGNTSNAMKFRKITKEQAEDFLQEDLHEVYRYLSLITRNIPLNGNQWSALVSFVFNIGIGAFINSTMLRKLKALDYEGASREFGKWVYSKGKKLDGLIKRRETERSLFLKEEVTDGKE